MRPALPAIAVSAIMAVAPAWADGLSAERVRALVERGEILKLEEILKRNEANVGGRIIEVEIEQKRGTYLYEIKVLRPDGRYHELKIDAQTGELARVE